MSLSSSPRLYLLVGPLVGVVLVVFSVLGNSGPGFFLMSLVALAGFGILTPLLQVVLRANHFLEQRPGVACGVSLSTVLLALLAIGTAAVFNQW